jgi:DNA-binding transcriptional LysR family regulator
MPTILRRLRQEGSDMSVTVLPIDADTGRKLASGEADLAIGVIPDLDSGFYQQTLYTQDWVCLANVEHPTSAAGRMTREDYERSGHVDVTRGTAYRLLHQALAKAKINRRVMVELPGYLGLAAIIRTTDLLATVPQHTGGMLGQTDGLRVLPCPFAVPTFSVKQYWHERFHHDSGNRWLRTVCAELFNQDSVRVPFSH